MQDTRIRQLRMRMINLIYFHRVFERETKVNNSSRIDIKIIIKGDYWIVFRLFFDTR